MRLESLTVQGFKSFADRTVFRFDGSGLTAIVGPNGCGKSNVLEAIKWVLGEQRPTSLRSREMTDVIFNGTSRRPPMGLCRVTLVFDNQDRTLPIDADKVEIFRQVTRGGDTSYAINRSPVRLKDIRQVFAGSGLGAGGYGFMEQGKIDSVLASNPQERRKVFEEAAGISRFRAQRHETELKLEKVVQNLTRLADIVDEVTRQIRSLKIQAGKARNHRELSARLEACGRAYCVHRFGEIETERNALLERLAELEGARESAVLRRDELRELLKDTESRVQLAQEELSDLRAERTEVQAALNAAREKLEFEGGYAEELVTRRARVAEGLTTLAAEEERLVEERRLVQAEIEKVQARSAEVTAAVTAQQEASQDVRSRADALERACVDAERRLANDERRLTELQREEARAEAELEGLAQRRAEAEERVRGLSEDLEGARFVAEETEEEDDQRQLALQAARRSLQESARTVDSADQEARNARKAVQVARETRDKAHSRQRALEGVLARREGLEEGPKRLLALAEKSGSRLTGLRGLAIETLEFTDARRATALQAALGDAVHALLVDTVDDALKALEVARAERCEGVLILPLSALPAADGLEPIDGVRAKGEEGQRVLKALLQGLEVVDAAEFATRAQLPSGQGASLLISVDGLARRDRGLFTAGRGQGSGLVHLQAEAQALAREVPRLVQELDAAELILAAAEAAVQTAREARQTAERQLGAAEREAARTAEAKGRAARELERLSVENKRLGERLAESVARLKAVQQRREELAEQREAASVRLSADREVLTAERERLLGFARERDAAASALEAVRIEAAEIGQQRQFLLERERSLGQRVAELVRRRQDDTRQIAELEAADRRAAEDLAATGEEIVALEEREERLTHAHAESERGTAAVRAEFSSLSAELRSAEDLAEKHGEALGSARGREGKLSAAREALLERAVNELQIPDLQSFVAATEERLVALRAAPVEATDEATGESTCEGQPEATADLFEAPPADEVLPEQDPTSEDDDAKTAPVFVKAVIPAGATLLEALLLDETTDWSLVDKEIRTLRDKIARLGNVNLAAVEELEEAERRAALIFKERDDLEESRAQLAKILKSLEMESTELFLATFNAVREHFAEIFRRLFGGGKAVMSLENPDTPLESGIEIKACPPGKEFRSITLLSGGERTMTAVALLFAIFRANPAPCAFLDEVDAALDEDNVDRFCRMVNDFTDRSQFVVVTHSKRTMEAADLLYGVTMPERGVSRPVKVRLEHLDDQGQIKDVEALNREAREEAARGGAELPAEIAMEEAAAAEPLTRLALPAMARRAERVREPAAESAEAAGAAEAAAESDAGAATESGETPSESP